MAYLFHNYYNTHTWDIFNWFKDSNLKTKSTMDSSQFYEHGFYSSWIHEWIVKDFFIENLIENEFID